MAEVKPLPGTILADFQRPDQQRTSRPGRSFMMCGIKNPMSGIMNPWRAALVSVLVASLLFSSGCATLLLLGAGGAGGYLIRKGEEGDSRKKKKSSARQVDQKVAFSSKRKAGEELALQIGGKP